MWVGIGLVMGLIFFKNLIIGIAIGVALGVALGRRKSGICGSSPDTPDDFEEPAQLSAPEDFKDPEDSW